MPGINSEKDLLEILKDFPDFFGQLTRTDVSIKTFDAITEYGETKNILKNEVIIPAYRVYPTRESQEWLRTQYGVDSAAEYEIIILTSDLISAGINEILHENLICFGDIPEENFEALTPLINEFPFGNNELLKSVYVKQIPTKQKYMEVK
ncbi:MAG: hypothetical protein KBA11_07825 [Sedimentibacter sp.]|nr:hypothetical protein [Sedimentibacter sp.]